MRFTEYQRYARQKYAWLEEDTKERYLNHYGTHTEIILAGCDNMADLGTQFAPTLYQAEVNYLVKHEWATNCEDILWRRTKLGLKINDLEKKALNDYLVNEF
jgi:glycerol-3-phosphate dehydrogenase